MRWTDWLEELRPHHWIKNILVFVPLALTPQLLSVNSVTESVLGFLILSITCSGTYLFNDVFDREADRLHWSKYRRPLASGWVSISSALLAGASLCSVGLLAATTLNSSFVMYLGAYTLLSLSYSYKLKTMALLDVIILATMFTLRIMMGIALIGVSITLWLPLFVFLFFGGLSAAKRAAELSRRIQQEDHSDNRRGYLEDDLPLLIAMGMSFSISSLILLSVFVYTVAVPGGIFLSAERLWLTIPLLLVWILRIWLLAVRGLLSDDPVLFSLKDRLSLIVGILISVSILTIHLP